MEPSWSYDHYTWWNCNVISGRTGYNSAMTSSFVCPTLHRKVDPKMGLPIEWPTVIYHGNCPDGFAAALCAWLYFDGRGDYIPLVHSDELPDLTGKHVYMLDIAFSREKMKRAMGQAFFLRVLDHHKSAQDDLKGLSCSCGSIVFNLHQSGAGMAWAYFFPGHEVPALIRHVEDRDLLTWLHADTAPYLASLDVGPYHFHRWAGIMQMSAASFGEFMNRGKALHAQSVKLARQLASNARDIVVLGIRGRVANAPNALHSSVGEELLKECGTFAMLWCLEEQGTRIKIGLRGAPDFDTIPIARAFGGGGHPNASAFRLPLERLGDMVSGTLEPVLL